MLDKKCSSNSFLKEFINASIQNQMRNEKTQELTKTNSLIVGK